MARNAGCIEGHGCCKAFAVWPGHRNGGFVTRNREGRGFRDAIRGRFGRFDERDGWRRSGCRRRVRIVAMASPKSKATQKNASAACAYGRHGRSRTYLIFVGAPIVFSPSCSRRLVLARYFARYVKRLSGGACGLLVPRVRRCVALLAGGPLHEKSFVTGGFLSRGR